MFFSTLLAQAMPSPVPWSSRCEDTSFGGRVATIQGMECVFQNVVAIAIVLAGLAVFLLFLAGGLKYLTSGGEPKAAEQAKNTLTYAFLGLVLMITSYLILKFLSEFTGLGAPLLNFFIPGP